VIRLKEDYELYFMLIGVPLALLAMYFFEKVNNTSLMAMVALVYIFGAFGGFGAHVRNSRMGHIFIFSVVGVFDLIFLLVEKIKSKKTEQQNSRIDE
jgi:hypothetical protein